MKDGAAILTHWRIEMNLSLQLLLSAGFICVLRIMDTSLDTLRVLFIMRGRKGLAWLLGFFESIIFVVAISSVVSDLGNPVNMIGYAAGFATGNFIGMIIEEKLAVGYSNIRVISSQNGAAIAENLRSKGFAVTEIPAQGKNGPVTILNCSVLRKHTRQVGEIVRGIDDSAFITTEDVRPIARGFWRP